MDLTVISDPFKFHYKNNRNVSNKNKIQPFNHIKVTNTSANQLDKLQFT